MHGDSRQFASTGTAVRRVQVPIKTIHRPSFCSSRKRQSGTMVCGYDQNEQGRVALIERDALTDDKAFETKRMFGHKLLLQDVKSISVPNAATSFLLSFEQEGDQDTKYFSVVTFSPGALDIKLFVSAVGGKVEVLDNPFRVRIWERFREPSSRPNQYKVAEYRLLNSSATKLAKVQQETNSSK